VSSARVRAVLRANSYLFALVLAIGFFIANVVYLPQFVAVSNWDTNLLTFAPFAILAMASTPAVLTGSGGLDLSVAPLANLVNVVLVTVLLTNSNLSSAWVAVPIVLALSTTVGLFNGVLVGILRYPPVVATVGMLLLLGGVTLRVESLPVPANEPWILELAGNLGPIPWGLVMIAVPFGFWALLRLTPFYRTLYMVGGNAATAYSAGVNVTLVRILAYGIGGLFAGVAGIALTALVQTSDPNVGLQYSLIAFAAVALGGTPIGVGGRGGVIGSLLGAAVIYLLQNLLLVSGVSNVWLQVLYGLLLIGGAVAGAKLTAPPRIPRAPAAARTATS
jgi:ribose transport system permease protein